MSCMSDDAAVSPEASSHELLAQHMHTGKLESMPLCKERVHGHGHALQIWVQFKGSCAQAALQKQAQAQNRTTQQCGRFRKRKRGEIGLSALAIPVATPLPILQAPMLLAFTIARPQTTS